MRRKYTRLIWLLLAHDLGDGMVRDYQLDPRVYPLDFAWPTMRVGICVVRERQMPPALDLIRLWNIIQVHDWRVLFVLFERVATHPRPIIAAISHMLRTRKRAAVAVTIPDQEEQNEYHQYASADETTDINGGGDDECADIADED